MTIFMEKALKMKIVINLELISMEIVIKMKIVLKLEQIYKKILLFQILNNGLLYGKKLKKNVYLENMPLNILYLHSKIKKKIFLS